jgi:endonuclease III
MHVHTTPGAKQSTHVARLPNSTKKKKEKEKARTEKKRDRRCSRSLWKNIHINRNYAISVLNP